MKTIMIESALVQEDLSGVDQPKKKGRKDGKTSEFRAELVATLSESGQGPVYASVLCSVGQVRPFVANIQMGSKIVYASDRRTKMSLSKMRCMTSPLSDRVVQATFFNDALFSINPVGEVVDVIEFCILVERAWLDAQVHDVESIAAQLVGLNHPLPFGFDRDALSEKLSESTLLLYYLERRTMFPFPMNPVFGFLVYAEMVYYNAFVQTSTYGLSDIGVASTVWVRISQATLDKVLKSVLSRYTKYGVSLGA